MSPLFWLTRRDRSVAVAAGGVRSGPGPFAADGSSVEVFAVLPPGPIAGLLAGRLPAGSSVLDLGCGAGRIAHVLAAHGHRVTGVDQSAEMLERVLPGVERVHGDIETLDLGRRFDAVILASYLVNTPDCDQRRSFLAACRRHLAPAGALYLERLDPELVPVAADADSEEDGIVYWLRDVRHEGPVFEAVVGFTIGGQQWASTYRGEVLDDDDLARELVEAGFRSLRYIDERRTWAEARP